MIPSPPSPGHPSLIMVFISNHNRCVFPRHVVADQILLVLTLHAFDNSRAVEPVTSKA